MDGKGRWRDNVFVERLWRSVKYEEVYLHAYETVSDARTASPATSSSSTPDARTQPLTGARPMPSTSRPCRSRRRLKLQSPTYPAAKNCPVLRGHLCPVQIRPGD